MKTSDFITKLKALGYEVEDNVGWVFIDDVFAMSKRYRFKFEIYESITDELFDLCVEYARTPIEERGDVKKYYLYNPIKKEYFNYHKINKYYVWSSLHQTENIQSQFTEEEIKNHKFKDIMELLVKEEVE